MKRRRLRCPEHGVVTEAVPFARPGRGSPATSRTWSCGWSPRPTRPPSPASPAWPGAPSARCANGSPPTSRTRTGWPAVDIGVDEISRRKHHKYLTLVSNHDHPGSCGAPPAATQPRWTGSSTNSRGRRGADRGGSRWTWGRPTPRPVRERAPQAVRCFDPFHVVKLVTDALEAGASQAWQSARRYPDKRIARKFKGARWRC